MYFHQRQKTGLSACRIAHKLYTPQTTAIFCTASEQDRAQSSLKQAAEAEALHMLLLERCLTDIPLPISSRRARSGLERKANPAKCTRTSSIWSDTRRLPRR